jgi:multicomponent Na+:H+ antiporter subunit D
MTAPTIALATVSVVIALVAGPLFALCQRAAEELLDPSDYLSAVLG